MNSQPSLTPHLSGRMQIVDYPFVSPGKCCVCGHPGGEGRKFIDFGFELDFYGVVYFCDLCLTDCCNSLGWLNPQQAEAAIKMNNMLENKILEQEKENELLRTALANLNSVFGVLSNPDPVNEITEEYSENTQSDEPEPDPSINKSDSESNEPIDEPGPENIPESKSSKSNKSDSGTGTFDIDDDFDFLEL